MNVLFLTDSRLGQTTAHVRARQLKQSLFALGVYVDCVDVRDHQIGELAAMAAKYDLVYTLKVGDLALHKLLKALGKTLLFDLSDALWLPHHQRCGWQDLNQLLALCDSVICENRFVRAYAQAYNSNVVVVSSASCVEKFARLRGCPKDIPVGWIGNPATALGIKSLMASGLNVYTLGLTELYSEDEMVGTVSRMKIGLFPIPWTAEDYKARGALKTLIYMSAGAVPICWASGVSADMAAGGLPIPLIHRDSEWQPTIDSLLASEESCKYIRDTCWNYVDQHHTLYAISKQLTDVFQKMIAS